MTDYLRDELRRAVRANSPKPLIVCGAGVSIAATAGKAPTWRRLVDLGVSRVTNLDVNSESWAATARGRLESGDAASAVVVADEVTERLGGSSNAEFATWLQDEFSPLRGTNNELLEAVLALNCPIAKTNYDGILASASGWAPISWSDHAGTLEVLSGKRNGVLHLHGHWQMPRDVVLGSKSYEMHSSDERRRFLQEYGTLDRPTIFIGCSREGLRDPDFSRLDAFVGKWIDVAQRRYWLLRRDPARPEPLPSPDNERRLFPVAFGEKHDQLPQFLHDLSGLGSQQERDHTSALRCIDQHEPKPEIFGRATEIELVVEAVLAGRAAVVAGGPGMGKTALATAALYDPRVVAQFGRRRVFVSLEAASQPHALLSRLADALGLPATGSDASLLRVIEMSAIAQPAVAVLDNAELLFESDRGEAERLLRLLAQIANLSTVVTLRGSPPALPRASVIDDLSRLPPEAARGAFLAVCGERFADDPDLSPLLAALDGHALSLQLVAGQATGQPTLVGLRERWDEAHSAILRRPDREESRLTSVRASLALSLSGSSIGSFPLARRLLAVLAHLPGGLAEPDAGPLLGDRGTHSRARVLEAISCVQRLRLVERRLDRRLRMLNPLRECARGDLPLLAEDHRRLLKRYLTFASKGDDLGSSNWEQVRDQIESEADNLDPICDLAVSTDFGNPGLVAALLGLSELHRHAGRVGDGCLDHAVRRFRAGPLTTDGANCLVAVAMNASQQLRHDKAQQLFSEALVGFRRMGGASEQQIASLVLGILRRTFQTMIRLGNSFQRHLIFTVARRTLKASQTAFEVLALLNCAAGIC